MDIAAMLTNLGLGRESIYSSGKGMWDWITASLVTPKMIRLVVLKWKDNISPLHLTSRGERDIYIWKRNVDAQMEPTS